MKLNDSPAAHTFLSSHPAPEKRAERLAAQLEMAANRTEVTNHQTEQE